MMILYSSVWLGYVSDKKFLTKFEKDFWVQAIETWVKVNCVIVFCAQSACCAEDIKCTKKEEQ